MSKSRAIIVDLDGTLCNNNHRQHFIVGEKKDFDSFNANCIDDVPNEWCVQLIQAIDQSPNYTNIIFVSGREGKYMPETKFWLDRHLRNIPYTLFMREIGDYRKDSEIKEEIYRKYIDPHYEVLFCIDDRQQVVDMWRANGLTCLQCAKGDF